ncbi:MAG: alcohol dehydrogenase catalytic domain-containing protein [Planctomycetota bacterium JB042]
MLAVTFQSLRRVAVESVPDPVLVESGDAIVRVERTAVCGSDMHVFHGRETGIDAGCVMGHEFLGEVVEAGPDAGVAVGTRVVSPFTTSCGGCRFCRIGLTCRCSKGALFGWVAGGVGLPGAQAEAVRVPLARSTLVPVPDGVDPDAALLCGDVLATGFFCAENGSVGPGDTVVVVGLGPVGLSAVLGAVHRGAARVLAVDDVPERLAVAGRLGGEPVDRSAVDPLEVVRDATDGAGADVVLEAVGHPSAARLAVDLVRPGGTVSSVGVHTAPSFPFSPVEAYDKNLTFAIGRCPARRLAEPLLELLRREEIDVSPLVTHRMPLADAVRAYDRFDRREDGCIKIVLEP